MNELLDFYSVSADYISYLGGFDKKVPLIDYSCADRRDKFLCGIVLSI